MIVLVVGSPGGDTTVSSAPESALFPLPQQVLDICDAIADCVDLLRDPLNFRASMAVDVEIHFAANPVLLVLAVLAHHDDRRLNGGEHGKKEVEQDERIGVPGTAAQKDVNDRVDDHEGNKDADERP